MVFGGRILTRFLRLSPFHSISNNESMNPRKIVLEVHGGHQVHSTALRHDQLYLCDKLPS